MMTLYRLYARYVCTQATLSVAEARAPDSGLRTGRP